MRLWHYKLIPVLPRQQLMGQWRELCLIARNIHDLGTPNHILVNPIMNYPDEHLNSYANYVFSELRKRSPNADWTKFSKYRRHDENDCLDCSLDHRYLFPGWHDDKYLDQCLLNLQEKHDRGGISDWEWHQIEEYCRRNYNFTVLNLYD